MDSQSGSSSPRQGEISFPNDNRAIFVRAAPTEDAFTLIDALKIKTPATVLLLIGGAGELNAALNSPLLELLDEGLGVAATNTDALIIDGGTEAGVMALMGKIVAKRGHSTSLLGIAPAGKVTYPGGAAAGSIEGGAPLDPNHSHFVLVEGNEWSSGTDTMLKLASEFARDARVVVVLVNGGVETRDEVSRCEEQGWPIIVIEGSGRLADQIAAQVRVSGKANFQIIALQDPPENLRLSIIRHAKGALVDAWQRFAQFDSKANLHQKKYRSLLSLTLAIGVLGTLFALSQKQFGSVDGYSPRKVQVLSALTFLLLVALIVAIAVMKRRWPKLIKRPGLWQIVTVIALVLMGTVALVFGLPKFLFYFVYALGYLALAVPIVVSVLLNAANRFKPRHKWILLRGSAEAVKQEIYRYRAKVGEYGDGIQMAFSPPAEALQDRSSEAILAENISTISRRVLQTEVNTASLEFSGKLPPQDTVPKSDDGFSFLTPERYIEVRLHDQLAYYATKTTTLERQMATFQWLIFVVGGLGTLLAALGHQLWIALTTALVTALSAWVGHFQLDHTLVQYNQTAGELGNLRAWWNALSVAEKARPENYDTLVTKSEKILGSEFSGWVQQMEDTTEDVRGDAKSK